MGETSVAESSIILMHFWLGKEKMLRLLSLSHGSFSANKLYMHFNPAMKILRLAAAPAPHN
jgi:hypothetical protein